MDNELILGRKYQFAGYEWIVAEINGGCAVLQSTGVTAGPWPGFEMPQFGNGKWYDKNIDGQNISSYDDEMSTLYETIKDAEYTDAKYGNGLYLVSDGIVGASPGHEGSGNYWEALKTAAENYNLFGAINNKTWLGTVDDGGAFAHFVFSSDGISYGCPNAYYVVAPAFNLDLSTVEVHDDVIAIKEEFRRAQSEENRDSGESTHVYRPKFMGDTQDCLLLESIQDMEECMAYADANNTDVLYLETEPQDTLKILMAFQEKGYKIELKEHKNVLSDGRSSNSKVEVLLTKK